MIRKGILNNILRKKLATHNVFVLKCHTIIADSFKLQFVIFSGMLRIVLFRISKEKDINSPNDINNKLTLNEFFISLNRQN